MNTNSEITWKINHITTEAPGVISLHLDCTTEKPVCTAGQYLTIKLPNLGPAEGKSYSISSAPHDEFVRVTIRKIGSFSSALFELKAGDTITTSTPYGFFYPEADEPTDLVFLAGGIGITPCLSIIKNLAHIKDSRKIDIFYSNQTKSDITFYTELVELEKSHTPLSVHHFITREIPSDNTHHKGRMDAQRIFEILPQKEQVEFFLCGSMDFTKSLWKELRDSGLPPQQIYTEGFF